MVPFFRTILYFHMSSVGIGFELNIGKTKILNLENQHPKTEDQSIECDNEYTYPSHVQLRKYNQSAEISRRMWALRSGNSGST